MYSVLQVTPALDVGGVERTTIEVAQALAQAGGQALVASRGGRWEGQLAKAGGELVRMPLTTKNPIEIVLNAGRIAALAKKRGVQIIHARSRAPGWSALIAARRLNLPFVTTYHGVYNARSGLKRAYNSVMAKGDVVIANSEFTRAHVLREHGVAPGRVVAIPRGVDLSRFDPAKIDREDVDARRRAFGAQPGDVVVLAPARLTAWKGQRLLVEAFARLNQRRPGAAHLVLAGDAQGRSTYVASLRERISALGLEARVTLTGHVEDMPGALAAADVAVFPTIEPEAFGRGAVEAAAMGVAVIAAGHGGLLETVVPDVTGTLFPPSDIEALTQALDRMIGMGAQGRAALGAAGAQRARALFSTEALQKATLQVYERVLSSRP